MAATMTAEFIDSGIDARDGFQAGNANRFGLTRRELEVIDAVLRAESNNRIASRLSIAPCTVKHHLSSIFAKVGVVTRVQLAMFAMNHRLTEARPGN